MAVHMIWVQADASDERDNVNYGQNYHGGDVRPWQEVHLTETMFVWSLVGMEISIYVKDANFYLILKQIHLRL